MKVCMRAVLVLLLMGSIIETGETVSAAGHPGEALFKQHCAACHPDGGNIINPQKTLQKKSREANKVMTADDIVKTMRNPGPGMTKFDTRTMPDKDARKIADYVITTFK